jgi:serine/threonine protein kinase
VTERFTLISELGRGGMGVVWKARDEGTGQIVALKLLHAAFTVDADYVTRFERELELARRIHSAHVVEVLGFGARDGAPYLALEFVDGPSLRELLKDHGPYAWPEAKDLLIQITQGLADAHAAGVIHRDLKPSNVLIGPDGTAKLADFGIAKGLDLTRVTGTSTLLGTPAYLAPEGPIDERSDLYSLGIIAFELLTGAAPFAGSTYQEVIVRHIRETPDLSKLPPEARDIVGWLLAKEPASRPQRASQLVAALYGAVAVRGGTTFERPPGPARTDAATRDVAVGPPQEFASVSQPDGAGPPRSPAGASTLARSRRAASIFVACGAILLVACLVGFAQFTAPPSRPTRAVGSASMSSRQVGNSSPTGGGVPNQTQIGQIGQFHSTGSTITGHSGHTATSLRDGQVLIVGGYSTSFAELYDPGIGQFSPTGAMATERFFHTATLLRDGRVLIAGGESSSGPSLSTAELYDPTTGEFSPTGTMATPRSSHTATLLADGRVLITGGESDGKSISSAELYDPATGKFRPTGAMTMARSGHTATLLTDGRVLITGGSGTTSAEFFNPKTGTFSPTGAMTASRSGHTATLLKDGSVLIAGGVTNVGGPVDSAELYNPTTGRFSPTGAMTYMTLDDTATLLENGRVLITGGMADYMTSSNILASTELYDPGSGTFSPAALMTTARDGHTASLLADGRVLIVGGIVDGKGDIDSSAELYTP